MRIAAGEEPYTEFPSAWLGASFKYSRTVSIESFNPSFISFDLVVRFIFTYLSIADTDSIIVLYV